MFDCFPVIMYCQSKMYICVPLKPYTKHESYIFCMHLRWIVFLDNLKARNFFLMHFQGRYDVCCPMMSAWDLHKAWLEAEFIVSNMWFAKLSSCGNSTYGKGVMNHILHSRLLKLIIPKLLHLFLNLSLFWAITTWMIVCFRTWMFCMKVHLSRYSLGNLSECSYLVL